MSVPDTQTDYGLSIICYTIGVTIGIAIMEPESIWQPIVAFVLIGLYHIVRGGME